MNKQEQAKITIPVKRDLYRRIRVEAAKRGVGMAAFIRTLMEAATEGRKK